jgi:alanyl-tRNA synthetase
VVPGNVGRNYICRMIIRRAARFGSKIGLQEPFLARIAEVVIENYGGFYPELARNRAAILSNLTSEEQRFQRTVESGVTKLENSLSRLIASSERILPGDQAFELYATYGLPLEITRDIAGTESGCDSRFSSSDGRMLLCAGEAFGPLVAKMGNLCFCWPIYSSG